MSDVKVNDGGPAFPQSYRIPGHSTVVGASGLSLRDYFAAKAMQAIIGCYKNTLLGVRNFDDSHDFSTFARDIAIDKNGQTSENDGCNEIAKDSYAFADAMLAARKEAPDGNRD